MLKWMRERLSRDEGFTLIELMVVVLIIAVLVAIAIPSFLGFRNRAQDRSAQSDVRSAILAEKGYYTDTEEFTNDATALEDFIPTLTIDTTGVTDDDVYVQLLAADEVCLHRESASGAIFSAYLFEDDATMYAKDDTDPYAAVPCTGLAADGWDVDPTDGW